MFNKRRLSLCAALTILAAALQAVPFLLGDAFAFAAILGGFPVYTAARLSRISGIVVYLTAACLTSIMGIGEALFFICFNGIIGLSLGIMKGRFKSVYLQPVPSALIVILMLSALNSFFDISVFGYSSSINPFRQALMLFAPLYIYCLIYLKLAASSDNLLHKYVDLNIH